MVFFYPCPESTSVVAHQSALFIIAFLIVGQLTSLGNFLSVCSLTADSRFGSNWWSFSPLPSTLPSFASSRRNTNSNNLRAKSLELLLERRSTFFLERYILLLAEPTSIVTSELSTFLSVLFWMEITFSFFWAKGLKRRLALALALRLDEWHDILPLFST